jgi:hypothetical protein
VRTDAEVHEGLAVLDRVAGDHALAGRLLVDQLDLERLAASPEERLGLLAIPELPLVGQILLRELAHLLLDGVDVLRHERPRHDEVIEEAFVGRRTDAALHVREQVGHRGREQVRRAVPEERQRFGAVRRHDADLRVVLERIGQIDETVVHDCRDRGLQQARRDRFRNVAHGRTRGHGAAGAVRQCDGDLTHC